MHNSRAERNHRDLEAEPHFAGEAMESLKRTVLSEAEAEFPSAGESSTPPAAFTDPRAQAGHSMS